MARRLGEDGRLTLSPRARLIGGWLAALLLVLGIAAAVRVLGGNGDGSDILPSPSGDVLDPIVFGTALDEQRLVPADAVTSSFVREDTFAYAVPDAEPASTVYVEVRRVAGGPAEVLQAPTDAQDIPGAPARIGFSVPAANLLDAFGPGSFEMRIFLDPAAEPIAAGTFELGGPLPSASGSP
jgi:hypothetical protein